MTGFTHLTFALFLEGNASLTSLAMVSFGSLFPDVDTYGALSRNFENKPGNLRHRGILHSPFLYAVIFLIYYLIFRNIDILPFLVGAMSHLALDFTTVEGIPIFYPLSKKKYHIFGLKTGSIVDVSMSFVFLFLFILRLFKFI